MENWRTIDIDAFEPDKHMSKEELIPNLPPTPREEIVTISRQCKSVLSQGQFLQALALVLDNAPYVSDEETKKIHAETVFEVLCSVKNNHANSDLSGFIKQLSSDQQDTLVKYLYKAMGESYGAKQGGLLLQWFEKTVQETGLGPIVRFISDRRTV